MIQKEHVNACLVGGVAGGLVFGAMMAMMGMMAMIAKLVGSDSIVVGWLVHLIISAVIGLTFAWWFGGKVDSFATGAKYGLLQGFIWWILGPLVIMPLMLGMGIQVGNALAQGNLLSLMGHLIYGVILGLVFTAVAKPAQHAVAAGVK